MNNVYPDKEYLKNLVEIFKKQYKDGSEDAFFEYLFNPDKKDKTSVFDFINDKWIEEV